MGWWGLKVLFLCVESMVSIGTKIIFETSEKLIVFVCLRMNPIDRSIKCDHFKTHDEGSKPPGSKVTEFSKSVKIGQKF